MQAQPRQWDKDGRYMPKQALVNLRNDSIVEDWLKDYPKSTADNYLSNFNTFLVESAKTPKEVHAMNAAELKRKIKSVCGSLVQQRRQYTAKNVMLALSSFAAHYDKHVKFSYGERIRVGKIKNEYILKPHEIYALAEIAAGTSVPQNPRNKALIKTDWVTALRKNAIRSLRWGAVLEYSEADCPIPLKVGNEFQTIGNGLWCIDDKLSGYGVDYYYTFIAKEGFLDILEWQQWLKKNGRDVQKNKYIFSQIHNDDPMPPTELWYIYKNNLDKIGIDKQQSTFHKLRDAFKSIMIKAEVDEEVREVMMGHVPKGSMKNYFDYHDVEMVRKQYMKADWTRTGLHRIDRIEKENMQLLTTVIELQKQVAELKRTQTNQALWQSIAELQYALLQQGTVTNTRQDEQDSIYSSEQP
jgi:integrase